MHAQYTQGFLGVRVVRVQMMKGWQLCYDMLVTEGALPATIESASGALSQSVVADLLTIGQIQSH